MKQLFILFALLFSIIQILAQPVPQTGQDLTILWQKNLLPWGIVDYAKFAPDGSKIYIASHNTIWKVDAKTGELDTVPFDNLGQVHGIYSMDISEQGNYIITSGSGEGVFIWDTKTERVVSNIKYFRNEADNPWVACVTISPDENYLLIGITKGGKDITNNIIVYDLIQDKELIRLACPGRIFQIKFSHDGRQFATGSQEYIEFPDNKYYDKLVLWDSETWQQKDELETIESEISGGGSYRRIKFSWDDKYLGAVRLSPHDARIFDLSLKLIKSKSDSLLFCWDIEFLPENNTYLISYSTYYNTPTELDRININSGKFLNSYNVESLIVESTDTTNNMFYVFCNRREFIALLGCNINNVTSNILKDKISIITDDGDLILKIYDILSTNIEIIIIDSIGRYVFSKEILNDFSTGSLKINTKLNSGVYLCKIKIGDKEYVQQITIVR